MTLTKAPTYSIIFWNVQRLFASSGSAIQHVLSMDKAGDAVTEATTRVKIATIAAVLDRISEKCGPPLLVGLAEIENAELAKAIARSTTRSTLADIDSLASDRTGFALDGLNLSLLVNRKALNKVSLLRSHVIDRTFDTRDILETDLTLRGGPKLSVLVNHWPSRLAGDSESRRLSAAHYANGLIKPKVRFTLSELWNSKVKRLELPAKAHLLERARHPVIVMGDFNDEVFDDSIRQLNATNDREAVMDDLDVRGRKKSKRFKSYVYSTPRLFNPFWRFVGRGGSYYRSPRWRTYDQILMSRGIVEPNGSIRYVADSAMIFSERHVTQASGETIALTNSRGKPLKYDPQHRRGCSDHFPVVVAVSI